MEDLTGIFARYGGDPITSLAPTSQSGGNMESSSALAFAPVGSEPTDPLLPAAQQGDPRITPTPYDTATVLRGASGQAERTDNADRSNGGYVVDDGAGWKSAQRSLGLPERPRLTHGRVNRI